MDGRALPCVCQLPLGILAHSSILEEAQSKKKKWADAGSSALTFILQVQLPPFCAVLIWIWTEMCSQILLFH